MTENMKNKRSILVMAYVIAIILAVFYLWVLYLSAHPNVSEEYRAFYMDHTLRYKVSAADLLVHPGEKLFLDGKKDSDTTFYGVGKGWLWEYKGRGMENTGYCYTGDKNNLLCFKTSGEETVKKIKLHILNSETDSMEIELDGTNIGSYKIENDMVAEIEIPTSNSGHKENADITHWINIKTDDTKTVSVDWVIFE